MYPSFHLLREKLNEIVCGRAVSPSVSPHFHSHIEIYAVLSGEIEILVNDRKKPVRAGELAVSLSYDTHGYRTPEAAEAVYLIVPVCFFEEFLPLIAERRLASPFINDPGTFETVVNAMERIGACGNDISRRGLVYVILGAVFDKMLPKDDAAQPQRGFSADILIFISERFRDELRLTDVAKEFGYSPAYLSRSFRKTFGISFLQYLTMLRLREAVLLLRSGKTVTECAADSGFGSMRSFYRAFSDEYACSPREYLANNNP